MLINLICGLTWTIRSNRGDRSSPSVKSLPVPKDAKGKDDPPDEKVSFSSL